MNERIDPSPEQQNARDLFLRGGTMVLEACAGSGKTTTLRMLTSATKERCLYLAFNRAVADDARATFPRNVDCRTAHSLAWRELRTNPNPAAEAVMGRLNERRIGYSELSRWLDIRRSFSFGDGRNLAPSTLAGLAKTTVANWCYSAAATITDDHVPTVAGLDDRAARQELTSNVVGWAEEIWNDAISADGVLRTVPDYYLKLYVLADRKLPYDVVCLDEAQDSNPLMVQMVTRQLGRSGRGVIIGDSAQAIYGWRGAVDAMTAFPAQHRARLSTSFRFGQPVADEANRFLSLLDNDMRVTGRGGPSTVGPIEVPDAVLCRSNAATMAELMQLISAGQKVAIVGGGTEARKLATAADELQSGGRTWHPDLSAFPSWGAVRDYVDHDGGAELRPFVNLIDSYGARRVIDAIDAAVAEEAADVVVSTAHQSKGREWNNVRIAGDFGQPNPDQPIDPAELMLAYVTVTRARRHLDLGSLDWIHTLVPNLPTIPELTTPTSPPPAAASVPVRNATPAIVEDWPVPDADLTQPQLPTAVGHPITIELADSTWQAIQSWATSCGRDPAVLIAEAMDRLVSHVGEPRSSR